jgi:hypothetical protein
MADANPFRNRLAESEAGNDQAPVQMPRDYSEGASGAARWRKTRLIIHCCKNIIRRTLRPSPHPSYNLNIDHIVTGSKIQ